MSRTTFLIMAVSLGVLCIAGAWVAGESLALALDRERWEA